MRVPEQMKPLDGAVADLNLNGHGTEQDSDANGKQEERLVVGVDFGTTYSGYCPLLNMRANQ